MTAPVHPDDPRATYYAEAVGWGDDRRAAEQRSARRAWQVAGVAGTIAVLEALALVGLMPLKTVVPYMLLVDSHTGYAQALEGGRVPQLAGQTALQQALLAQYVLAREGFDRATVQEQYRKVAAWSADGARRDYLAQMPAGNPQSPFNTVPAGVTVGARVESVSALGPGVALVRFATHRADRAGEAYWVATLRYRFSGEPMALEDRLINPLGLAVTAYTRDQEAPPPAEPTASPPAVAPFAASAAPASAALAVPAGAAGAAGGALPAGRAVASLPAGRAGAGLPMRRLQWLRERHRP